MPAQKLQFTVSAEIPATPERIYKAWLNGGEHGAMTGMPATAGINVGDPFTAHGDYAYGRNEELVPYTKIVQLWRTTEFDGEDADSVIEILLEEKDGYTLLTLTHSNLPPHGAQYEQGWNDYYFEPMKAYFSVTK
jgi:hypothetical protein